ncbi:hypothetical protein IAE22_30975 [Bacillus sp. S34]|nr:hypothetical protein [Bacillus sp. S34]
MDDLERIMRKRVTERTNGPEDTTSGPFPVQRWPLGRDTDAAYMEADDCD